MSALNASQSKQKDRPAEKPLKYTVAIILRDAKRFDHFLVVKRPSDDPDLGGHWGLPAATLQPGELPQAAAERICREKLNCRAVSTRFIGAMFQKRNTYDICLMDIEMILVGGRPDCCRSSTNGTSYVSQKWSSNPSDLMASAQGGSCCSTLFLTEQGLLGREDWLVSLEGSHTVG